MAVYARFKSVTFQSGCGLPNRAVISVTDALAMRAKMLFWLLHFPFGLWAARSGETHYDGLTT